MPQSLVVENDGRLRVLRLNRPERKNALNGELLGAIVGAVRDAAEDHGVWALALTGNGDAFFSGLDLSANDPDEADRASPPAYGRMLAGIAPIAAQQTKRLVSRVTTPAEFRAHLDKEARLALHGLSSEDSSEALRAMTTKESPHFKGR